MPDVQLAASTLGDFLDRSLGTCLCCRAVNRRVSFGRHEFSAEQVRVSRCAYHLAGMCAVLKRKG